MSETFLEDEAALQSLIAGFEDGTWPGAQWRHSSHLALAACYILDYPDAMNLLRSRIASYNESRGGKNTPDSGYHETITRFWVEIISRFIGRLPPDLSRLEVARRVVASFGNRRDLFRDYYDFDVVTSREARAAWVPPIRPLALDD
jgi:hypothetical protein